MAQKKQYWVLRNYRGRYVQVCKDSSYIFVKEFRRATRYDSVNKAENVKIFMNKYISIEEAGNKVVIVEIWE